MTSWHLNTTKLIMNEKRSKMTATMQQSQFIMKIKITNNKQIVITKVNNVSKTAFYVMRYYIICWIKNTCLSNNQTGIMKKFHRSLYKDKSLNVVKYKIMLHIGCGNVTHYIKLEASIDNSKDYRARTKPNSKFDNLLIIKRFNCEHKTSKTNIKYYILALNTYFA